MKRRLPSKSKQEDPETDPPEPLKNKNLHTLDFAILVPKSNVHKRRGKLTFNCSIRVPRVHEGHETVVIAAKKRLTLEISQADHDSVSSLFG